MVPGRSSKSADKARNCDFIIISALSFHGVRVDFLHQHRSRTMIGMGSVTTHGGIFLFVVRSCGFAGCVSAEFASVIHVFLRIYLA